MHDTLCCYAVSELTNILTRKTKGTIQVFEFFFFFYAVVEDMLHSRHPKFRLRFRCEFEGYRGFRCLTLNIQHCSSSFSNTATSVPIYVDQTECSHARHGVSIVRRPGQKKSRNEKIIFIMSLSPSPLNFSCWRIA